MWCDVGGGGGGGAREGRHFSQSKNARLLNSSGIKTSIKYVLEMNRLG